MPIPEMERLGGWSEATGARDMSQEVPPRGPDARPGHLKPVVTGAAMLGLFYGLDHWANPLLKATHAQRRGFRVGWLTWTLGQIARFVTPGKRYVASEISQGLLQNGAAPATTLRNFAYRWTQTQAMLAHFAMTTAIAVERIVHVKIPLEVHRQVQPVRRTVRRLRVGQIRLADDLNGVRIRVHQDVPKHGKTRLRKLEKRVYIRDSLELGRITRLETATRKTVRKHDHFWKRASWVARFAGPVPLVLYAFRRLRIQSLLCRNTRSFNNEICASPSGTGRNAGRLLKELVGLFMDFLGALSVVAFAVEVYELLNIRIPGLGHSALHYIKEGITEVADLTTADYLGPVDFPLDLHATDYLS